LLQRHWLISTGLVIHLLACAVAGQDGPNDDSPSADLAPAGTSIPAELDTIFLRDVDGVYVPVLNMPYEKFQEIHLRSVLGEASGPPAFAIQSFVATGQARQDWADLKVTVTVTLRHDGWIGIPLRLGQAALRRLPTTGPTEGPLLTVHRRAQDDEATTEADNGYILWLRGDHEEVVRTVELDFVVPVSGIGRERRMVLSVPKAAKSELKLTVPVPNAEAEVSNETILESAVPSGDSATELTIVGLRGDVGIVWRRANGHAGSAAHALTSFATVTATLDRQSVQFDANLRVSDRDRELNSFEVRLPVGASLTETQYEGYAASDVSGDDLAPGEGRIVEVRLNEPVEAKASAEVTLKARCGEEGDDGQFALAGFQVVDAMQQQGTVIVRSGDDWDVRCQEGQGVERISELPDGIEPKGVKAVYRIYRQPFTLAARVFQRQIHVRVEPRYEMAVQSDRVELDAELKYAVRGKETYRLDVDMQGWVLDSVGPEEVVVPETYDVPESGILSLRLQDDVMVDFVVSITAHRDIEQGATSIELPLPRPAASSVSSALLQVLPADNVELRENVAGIAGLVAAPPLESVVARQGSLAYRTEGDQAVFAATLSVREQEISVEAATDVTISEEAVTVSEVLTYDVKYEPVDTLLLRVPSELAQTETLELTVDGEPVAASDVDSQGGGDVDWIVHQVVLPSPRSGRFDLIAAYTMAAPKFQPKSSALCDVPLIMPEEGHLLSNRVTPRVAEGIQIGYVDGNWLETEDGASGAQPDLLAKSSETRIVFGVRREDPDTFGSTVVHLAWIQTWMTDRQRRDRAVYQLVSNQRHLEVALPAGADAGVGSLYVLIDGQAAEFELERERRVRMTLPHERTSERHVIEVWYHFLEARPPRGDMVLELPTIAGGVRVRRSYWQLVLPSSEHVITAPVGYTPEYEWGWRGLWWGRIPVKEQADLEDWIGAIEDTALPESTSRYLYSDFGPHDPGRLRTASRTWIVGGASAVALLCGLLLVYVPGTRHPVFGLLAMIGVTACAVIWPGAALLFAQAAGMGLALALVGALLYRSIARRRRRSRHRDLPSSILDRGSTQAQFAESELELAQSTATEPEGATIRPG